MPPKFDMQAARDTCTAIGRDITPRDGAAAGEKLRNCLLAADMLPAALDEIERQSKEIDSWIADRDSWIARYQEQAKRIAELEAAYLKAQNSNLLRKQAYERLEKWSWKQRAALKILGQRAGKRGKALVEERAKRLCRDRGECSYKTPIRNSLISKCDKGVICDWLQCPIQNDWREEAREQLRDEGLL